ncbi:MAG: glycosyltransferase family 2 protein [Mucilaginibacter sp.]|uniref:glycosyltransferase family 2 protein n=1 Tax=Mucilaginibacter sp. TaxID=1882438 RepID=UPI0032631B61
MIKIAVYIPTLNAGIDWPLLLESISTQNISIAHKAIIDSGSIDNTIDTAKQYGFEIIQINKNEFNHGATRQKLVNLHKDVDICVFLTQDAILTSFDSIANITKVFEDLDVGMAYGRQLPHKGAKTLETHARLYNYPSISNTLTLSDKDRLGFKAFFCSNSFSAYRVSMLNGVGGFPSNSIMGEDAIVAAKMLTAGFKKAYVADATVYHSHSYTLTEEFKRYFDTRVFHEQNKWLLTDFGKPTGEGLKFIKSEISYVIKNDWKTLPKSLNSVLAKWLGYNTGRFFKRMPLSVLKKLSMHSFYWK